MGSNNNNNNNNNNSLFEPKILLYKTTKEKVVSQLSSLLYELNIF